jgi:hypothetical protein
MNDRKFAPIQTEWDDRRVEQAVDEAIALKLTSVKKSSMKLASYNGFSGEVRVLADRKIKVAIELTLIPRPTRCSVCHKSTGRIDYHAEDYGRPLRVAPICQGCHLALHNRLRGAGYAESWKRRVGQYGDGTKWFEHLE